MKTLLPDDRVRVRGHDYLGLARVLHGINDVYSVRFDNGTLLGGVKKADLRHVTPAEEAAEAHLEREAADVRAARRKRALEMLDLIRRPPDGDPESDEITALRRADEEARGTGRNLGYLGAPRSDYAPGDRVRVRDGVDLDHFDLSGPGAVGTVLVPDAILASFDITPFTPLCVRVLLDTGEERLIYVTNLEPEA